jgi:LPPG:FO 2-phospho-L-lactate transferase
VKHRAGLVVTLSGGTGGAKLARGLVDVCAELVVIANTADDVEIYGVHVAPDPDLVAYWLADLIDDRGYGLRDDTWRVMEALEGAGIATWFRLGDRDLAMCLIRTQRLRERARLTEAHAAVVEALGVTAKVLPMCDEPVQTWVRHRGRALPFQEYMIVERASPPVEGVELRGVEAARPSDEVLGALARAELIVLGPSNPVISVGPILAVPGMREALAEAPAPVVAVSPFVGGRSVKGPSEHFCTWAGIEPSATGVARAYAGVIDAMVADEGVEDLPCLVTDTLLDAPEQRRRLADTILEFGRNLSS